MGEGRHYLPESRNISLGQLSEFSVVIFTMSSGNPSSSTDGKSPTPYAQHGQNTGNLYSFSVHQPYTNWPLHASHSTPYAPSWYAHPAHQYNLQRSYRNQGIQASPEKNEGSGDAGRKYLSHWDPLFVTFLKRLGLQQTLAGFHEDMLLLSEDWECKEVPGALKALAQDLSVSTLTFGCCTNIVYES